MFDSGNDEDPWNVLVSTTYTNAAGYAGIAEEFEKIRREPQTLAVDGKSLKELGTVVASVTVYENPAELAGYNKVIIDPVEVSFRKDWDPKRAGSRAKLSAQERENIRSGVGRIVQEEFTKTLEKGAPYKVVKEAGEMTLVGELIDYESGQVISRVIDRREARNSGVMQLTNSVVNAQEARAIAASWARILRSRLDAAHAAKIP